MNIYNTLYILEYNKNPLKIGTTKNWCLNLSKIKYLKRHRGFDLMGCMHNNYKVWYRYNRRHRLIGPAYMLKQNNKTHYYCKAFYIIDECQDTIYIEDEIL